LRSLATRSARSRLGDSHQSISPLLDAAPVQGQKFDAIEIRHLGAGGETRDAAAPWAILLEARECGLGAADMFLTVDWWRRTMAAFYQASAARHGAAFTDDTALVWEWFAVVRRLWCRG